MVEADANAPRHPRSCGEWLRDQCRNAKQKSLLLAELADLRNQASGLLLAKSGKLIERSRQIRELAKQAPGKARNARFANDQPKS